MSNVLEDIAAVAAAGEERRAANAIRALAMDAVEKAKSGHPGMPMGMADVATVLFKEVMTFDASAPDWPNRDRFVLSAGHGSMLLYALLYLLGYPGVVIEDLKSFRQFGAKTPGHPEYGHTIGVETTTGPLGQGLATAVGFAIAERLQAARFSDDLVDHRTYVLAGDGCLMEGVSHEAIDLAGHLRLGRLIVLWDDNGISIDGPTTLSTSTDQLARFSASGWHVQRVDGHAPQEIAAALAAAQQDARPSLIACRSVIGYGAPGKQGKESVHGAPLGETEIELARAELGWPYAPFEVPEEVLADWRAAGARGREARLAWEQRLAASPKRAEFETFLSGDIASEIAAPLAALRAKFASEMPKIATRKSSETTLAVVNEATSRTIGGSADLTHSNFTITKGLGSVTAEDFSGRYIHYGVREHGMAAAMNGVALHGGFVPYGGTFLVFSDYARGAMRLSALMNQRVVYVMTHDSIGLGEDGPTHQPIEHLASLRAMPNLNVFRPADAIETAECWEIALTTRRTPSVLSLSRQNLATLERPISENLSARGAYVLREPSSGRQVTLIATGSEVEIALAAADLLWTRGVRAAVVSMPCWELFEAQSAAYRNRVLGSTPRVAVEAASRFGWDRWLGDRGEFVGMSGFGASAPAGTLYRHFGVTAENVAAAAETLLRA
ncbi:MULTISPECIES: transketolase [Methylosinus]|uniref:Transketolase n=1 Tax=Methylosinus trichosporium (strain ATCC 35070 / NCIMB 11131 / UNIQEM 75 / OB3b) TaxID=595536 RepID=A0A2D2D3Q4_METT3|nr:MULTISPECIES: transketolase [Methylosinus]ATQ69632.1 transketolase [Methylosinus trichosporium OB3b]OBS53030.1 transketolase [Methylosinus sp. 3S-1]